MPATPLLPALLQLLAPARCAACDGLLEESSAFCPACAPLLEPLSPAGVGEAVAAAGFVYGGPLADAIARLKYGRRTELGEVLGQLLVPVALQLAGRVQCVVPMPLHPIRLRERGFNQSALIARPVARALGLPVNVRCLRRIRPTTEQAALSRDARADNVRGAFASGSGRAYERILLLDDVRTTGATLAEAAAMLVRGGCSEVHTLALARAL